MIYQSDSYLAAIGRVSAIVFPLLILLLWILALIFGWQMPGADFP